MTMARSVEWDGSLRVGLLDAGRVASMRVGGFQQSSSGSKVEGEEQLCGHGARGQVALRSPWIGGQLSFPHVSRALWSLCNRRLPNPSLEGKIGGGRYHPCICQRWHGAVPMPTHPLKWKNFSDVSCSGILPSRELGVGWLGGDLAALLTEMAVWAMSLGITLRHCYNAMG